MMHGFNEKRRDFSFFGFEFGKRKLKDKYEKGFLFYLFSFLKEVNNILPFMILFWRLGYQSLFGINHKADAGK